MAELVRFRIADLDGIPLDGYSVEMPSNNETTEECLERLRAEFGTRLIETEVIQI